MKIKNYLQMSLSVVIIISTIVIWGCKKDDEEQGVVNSKPTILIKSPENNSSINQGETVTISVKTEDGDGTISEVRFYIDNIGKGSSSSFPYNYNWDTSDEEVGSHRITASAYDNEGASNSAEINISLTTNSGDNQTGTVIDIDGNNYQTVTIGTQEWMAENLKVTHYPNGNAIPLVTTTAWSNLADNNTDDAYSYYNNNTADVYGALYTYAAAIGDNWTKDLVENQGVCPDGWHLPTDADWDALKNYLGSNAGSKLAGNATLWQNGSLEQSADFGISGFSALPSGSLSYDGGTYGDLGVYSYWWSANESDFSQAGYRKLYFNSSEIIGTNGKPKSNGYSVRCVKD